MIKSFQLISDASHGWVKVPLTELARLGIQDKISAYSYVKGDFAFLEEDADATVFINARKAEGHPVKLKEITRESCRKIRNYASYPTSTVTVISETEVEIKPTKQLSMTPSAIRKREARAKAKANA